MDGRFHGYKDLLKLSATPYDRKSLRPMPSNDEYFTVSASPSAHKRAAHTDVAIVTGGLTSPTHAGRHARTALQSAFLTSTKLTVLDALRTLLCGDNDGAVEPAVARPNQNVAFPLQKLADLAVVEVLPLPVVHRQRCAPLELPASDNVEAVLLCGAPHRPLHQSHRVTL